MSLLAARPRRFLAALLLLDAVLLAAGIARAWDAHPFLTKPIGDALEYWEWAGRLAQGEWIGATPYLSAPLYPWLLGALRALGAGLPAVIALQLLFRSATAALLWRAATRAGGGPGAGCAAAALFLLLAEPAFFATRLVACSLQLLLLAWLLDAILRLGQRRGAARLLGLGALLGANLLATPPLLLFAFALPAWFGWRGRAAWRATGLVLAGAALTVAPATLHNALATRSQPGGAEFILISAQAGVTYAHGNGPGAIGVYRAIPGVSQERGKQNQEAYALAARATGTPGWKNMDRFFRTQAVDWLLAHPADAALLHLRKAGFLLFGQDYGDLYSPALEREDPELPRPVPPPFGTLPTPWLLPAACAGAWLLARQRVRIAAPILAALLIPCATVVLFWYSPRYRLPMVIPACLLAPLAWQALLAQPSRARQALLVLALLAPVAAGRALMLGAGLDDAARFRPEYAYHVGVQWLESGKPEAAEPRFAEALRRGFSPAASAEMLGRARLASAEALAAAGAHADSAARIRAALDAFATALEHEPERLDSLVDAARAQLRLAERHGDAEGVGRARELLERALRITLERGDRARSDALRRLLASLPPGD